MRSTMTLTKASIAKLGLAAAITVAIPGTSFAADPGFFIGFSAGQTFIDTTENGVNFEDEDTSYQLQASYNFDSNWGIQAAYQRLGDFDDGEYQVDIDGFEANVMYSHDLSDCFSLHARAGVIQLDSESRRVVGGQQVARVDDDNTRGVLTFGGNFKADETLSFNVEAKYIPDSDIDLYLVQAGLQGRFGGANQR